MKTTRFIIALILALGVMRVAIATQDFKDFTSTRNPATFPLGPTDLFPIVQGGVTVYAAGNLMATRAGSETLTNKTIDGHSNTLTVLADTQMANIGTVAHGFTGLSSYTSGGIVCATGTTTLASSALLTANKPLVGAGVGACPAVGSTTGPGTLFLNGSGSYTSNHGTRVNASGNIVDVATAVYTDTANTFTAAQTFGSTLGTQNAQAGATYTFAQTDCGKPLYMTSSIAVTITLPATITVPCTSEVGQGGAGQVTFALGSGATGNIGNTAPANPHGFTKTFGKDARVGVQVDVNPGGTAAHWVLSGDGS